MLDGWTLLETTTGPKANPRPYHMWFSPDGKLRVDGEPHGYGRPWCAMRLVAKGGMNLDRGKTSARWETLCGKDHKRKRYGATVKGATRWFTTPEAAARAVVAEWGDHA
jgi:hypothetical protein